MQEFITKPTQYTIRFACICVFLVFGIPYLVALFINEWAREIIMICIFAPIILSALIGCILATLLSPYEDTINECEFIRKIKRNQKVVIRLSWDEIENIEYLRPSIIHVVFFISNACVVTCKKDSNFYFRSASLGENQFAISLSKKEYSIVKSFLSNKISNVKNFFSKNKK